MATCKICGGWAREFPNGESHALCVELQKLNLPTPCLGHMCKRCEGRGHLGGPGGSMLFLSFGPSAIKRSIEAQFPVCQECNGRGVVR